MDNQIIQEPCFVKTNLVQTAQGFSLSYNNRFLYSKYNPSKLIVEKINQLEILKGTLVLCNSPALFYGLNELINKLPPDCFILACEFEDELYDFSLNYLLEQQNKGSIQKSDRFAFLTKKECYDLPLILNKNTYRFAYGTSFINTGVLRRIISIDFSAGTSFNQQLYKDLHEACTTSLMTFWSNRVTLTKFGRKYSAHFFQNLKIYPKTTPIEKYFNSIAKPIVVFGSGESTDYGIQEIYSQEKNFFILCADTALQPLLKSGIHVDGVFVEEAQHIISKTFIGTQSHDFQIFVGLSAIPQLAHLFTPEKISFFTTRYTNSSFLNTIAQSIKIPPVNAPFGSVGLTAVYYALKFRKNMEIPVYVYGLDFSYSAGKTHAKGTLSHISRLSSSNKINSVQNYGASFSSEATAFIDKNKNIFYTTRVLEKYSTLFNAYFSNVPNLYDSSNSGIPLQIKRKKPELVIINSNNIEYNDTIYDLHSTTDYINNEIQQLTLLRDILSGKIKLSKEETNLRIQELSGAREYLYLHFPDGWQFSSDIAFLKRIRREIDYFLKIMQI